MPLQIVHHPDYDAGFAVNHRFPMSKYPLLMEALSARGLAGPEALSMPRPAPASWLKLAHAAEYVDQVLACEVPAKIEREIGFPVGPRVSLRAQLAAARNILIVDLDVHQGDGTADILGDERRVFTFSMHGDRNYPARKIASDLDIALPDGTGDADYLERLGGMLAELTARAPWDIVFYNAGVDAHADDRLGRLSLSD
ncbi:MAG: hypothetical protein E5Y69_31540 [Mesorhizobium sp.]|nr:MAG: hypothetical protein E5Y69_31540 [Mesorhizobium sp.]